MSESHLPTEVELAYEVMPCNALRSAQHPGAHPHPCSYFLKWGRYHSYDYETAGPPPKPGIVQLTQYVGRGPLVPEILSGCRKAPIMAVGINPNLPGWWPLSRNAINPLFDDYKQYAHYFRYRATAKLQIPKKKYEGFGGDSPQDQPLTNSKPPKPSTWELNVPVDDDGFRTIPVETQALTMYENYESLLKDLAKAMGWKADKLSVGEDLSYGNMVGCPSAKWINKPDPKDKSVPPMPPMTASEQKGIVGECFHTRKYFLRQLFQSLPNVLMIFSQSTTDAFVAEMQGRFSKGNPKPGDQINDLLHKTVRLRYGTRDDGSPLEARVIFSPHITGNPTEFGPARQRVLDQLIEEATLGNIRFNSATGHLSRPPGSCVFCTMLDIGPCDYLSELKPLKTLPILSAVVAASPAPALMAEKEEQRRLLENFLSKKKAVVENGWELSADPERSEDQRP